MLFSLACTDAAGVPVVDSLGAVSCTAGTVQVVATNVGLEALTADDVLGLLSMAAGVLAAAWGFKVLGRLLFKGA